MEELGVFGGGLVALPLRAAVDKAAVAAVQVSGTQDAPAGCRLLGPLEAIDNNRWVPGGPRYETAMLSLREKAVLAGGNRLQIDSIVPPRDGDYNPAFVVRARVFSCPGAVVSATVNVAPLPPPVSASAAPVAPTPPPARACEPECSPGYACLRGTCVSACNPVCGAHERCGVDRICHPVAPLEVPRPVPP